MIGGRVRIGKTTRRITATVTVLLQTWGLTAKGKEVTVANKKAARRRPRWITDAERVPSGSLVVVSRTDGTSAGFRLPKSSLREKAAPTDTEAVAVSG
jgi:hypothetical protein